MRSIVTRNNGMACNCCVMFWSEVEGISCYKKDYGTAIEFIRAKIGLEKFEEVSNAKITLTPEEVKEIVKQRLHAILLFRGEI